MSPSNATHGSTFSAAAVLCRGWDGNQHEREEHSENGFHLNLLSMYLDAD
jgi:hypothetical protein